MMKQMSGHHTRRLMAAFVAAFVLILMVSHFSIESVRRVTLELESGENHFQAITNAATEVSSYAKRAEGHLMLYLSFHGKIDRDKVPKRMASLVEQIAILDRLVKIPDARRVVEKIKRLEEKSSAILLPLIGAHDLEFKSTGMFQIEKQKLSVLDAHELFSQMRALGVDLAEMELELENQFKNRLGLTAQKMRMASNIVIFGISLFLVLLGIFLIRINQQLNREILSRKQAETNLKKSEKNLQLLSRQTEQLSLCAAEIISMTDREQIFQKISNAIVEYSDYQRVIISLFKEVHPYRDIVGYAGINAEKIDHLRRVDFPKKWYDGVFEQGIQIGQFSFYIPHTLKHILNQEATCYGQGPKPETSDVWHPEDNLFVRLNDEHGGFVGVISVDDSKSGEIPSDQTIRPLEIFASLISQIIILKREQEERHKIEGQLQQSVKMESIGTMAGGIAHDFNNILGIILGNAELAMTTIETIHPASPFLEEIKSSSLRAADIVGQLLSFSRKSDHQLKPLKITAIIDETLGFLRSTIPTTVDIVRQYLDPDSVVMADHSQINQVVMNLCINAFQAMDNGKGRINILVQKVDIKPEETRHSHDLAPGKYVKIIVSDTGNGIPREIVSRIFDPYFTTKDVGKGSGMGLSVVVGILKAHQGTIVVDSELGKGTVFSILLPRTDEQVVLKNLDADPPVQGNESILIVDDDRAITQMLEKILQRLGYKVMVFNDPVKALERFRLSPDLFDMVITDMTMPEMTGADLARELLTIRKNIPVLVCTGHSDLIDEKTASDLGIAAFVTKPFAIGKISMVIRDVLDRNKTTPSI